MTFISFFHHSYFRVIVTIDCKLYEMFFIITVLLFSGVATQITRGKIDICGRERCNTHTPICATPPQAAFRGKSNICLSPVDIYRGNRVIRKLIVRETILAQLKAKKIYVIGLMWRSLQTGSWH